MGILDNFKRMFESDKLDVSARFELDRHAFTGTMSKFRVAREIKTGKTVGLKLLDVEKTKYFEARFPGLSKPSEGEIALKLNHPRIVETFEAGVTTANQPYILMEYIPGSGLNTLIQERSEMLKGKSLHLFRQMVEAIGAVHAAGFIHRDVCPRNFIVAPDCESLKLIDFGLTLPNEAEYRMPGNRTGTPQYMAPEIVRRRSTDHRVDIFALGVTGYRLCTFEHPWGVTDTTGKAALHFDQRPPKPILEYRPDLNRKFANAIMSCIEAEPDKRPDNTDAIQRMLFNVDSELEGKNGS